MSTLNYEEEWLKAQAFKQQLLSKLQDDQAAENVADYWERSVRLFKDLPCIASVDNDVQFTYGQLDRIASCIAAWSVQYIQKSTQKVSSQPQQTRCIAFVSRNSCLYPAVTIGLAKVGWTIALINFNLKGDLLGHAIKIAQPSLCLVDEGSVDNVKEALSGGEYASLSHLPIYTLCTDQDAMHFLNKEKIEDKMSTNLQRQMVDWWNFTSYTSDELASHRRHVNQRDPFVYIYTSGTTGASKAAKFSHKRWIGCGLNWSYPSKAETGCSYYIPLPLYHGNGGAVALSTVFMNGMRAVIREKFSVSQFWTDISKWQCRYMIHVGELWRYLTTLPADKIPKEHPLRVIVGNGLKEETWRQVMAMGIERIVEHYGSTEMPGDSVVQWFNVVGSCGYVPPQQKHLYSGVLVKYNLGEKCPVRNAADGFMIEVQVGESGELIMPLDDGKYDGYLDQSQTERKLYRSVFRDGDVWFSTGDLLKCTQDGFYYFVDRTGDTFRWKGENVATVEVENIIYKYPGVQEANVVGVAVEGYEGKAGMLILSLNGDDKSQKFNLADFSQYVDAKLPKYAVPQFIRLLSNVENGNEKTSTFKYRKDRYVKEGFDPAIVKDDLYVFQRYKDRVIYTNLSTGVYQSIISMDMKL
ncbi:hypothetical protein MIR68_009869 [Amoeboaphelidium protococcarum]|nr:hypothetical protein MIR68_009869 [Amoeboaphelidium protococcarum]